MIFRVKGFDHKQLDMFIFPHMNPASFHTNEHRHINMYFPHVCLVHMLADTHIHYILRLHFHCVLCILNILIETQFFI